MDAGKLFVLILSVFVISLLVHLESKSRGARRESNAAAAVPEPEVPKRSARNG